MRSRLVLLTGQTITLGLMIAFLVVPASALFLSRYGADGLPYAYLAVAVSGVLVSAVIRRALARRSVVVVALSVLTSYLVTVASGWLLLTMTGALWVTFPLLVLFPLSIPLGFLIVGAQAGRLLDVREMKAHLPRVVAGFSVGFGLGSLTSAWLAPLLSGPAQLLGLSVGAAAVMMVLVAITARRHAGPLRTRPVRVAPLPSAAPRGRAELLRNTLVLTLFGYQLLSAAVSQLLDYIVWERAAAHYPDPLGLTRFMGLFGVLINVVTIVFVAGFAGRLLTRFGVGVGLWANPAGVLVALMVAVVAGSVGGLAGVGFFVAACAGQVVDIALTDGMTRTGISATYQVLPAELRLRAQAMIEGAGVPLALGFVGVLLLVFHAVSLSVLVVAAVTAFLALLWLLLARKAFLDYGRKLRLAVTSRPWDPRLMPISDPASREALRRLLDSPEPADRGVGLRALAESGDRDLPRHVADLLADPDPGRQMDGLDTAVRGAMIGLAPQVLHIAVDQTRPGAVRAAAIEAYVRLGATGATDVLAVLLDDFEPSVRVATAAAQVDAAGALGSRALDIWRRAVDSGGESTHRALTGAAASPSHRFVPDLLGLASTSSPPMELTAALAAHADLLVPILDQLLGRRHRLCRPAQSPVADGTHHACGHPELVARGARRVAAVPHLRLGGPSAPLAARALAAADRTVDPALLGSVGRGGGPPCRAGPRGSCDRWVHPLRSVRQRTQCLRHRGPLRRALRDEIDSTAADVGRLIAVTHGGRMARAVAALGGGSASERGACPGDPRGLPWCRVLPGW